MDARIIRLTISPPATATHFQIGFSADRGATWTPFDPAAAAPSAYADIAVASLSSGVYTLDGINSPAGNQAAASRAGNLYRYRLKTAGAYGNWSHPFGAVEDTDTYGPLADPEDVLQETGLRRESLALAWPEVERLLMQLLTDAMDEHRLDAEIDGLYTGTRTAAQERLLARAERCRAASLLLGRPAVLRALGDHPPLLMEDSADLTALADRLAAEADALVRKVAAGSATETVPFALPRVGAGTFTFTSADRTPADRMALQDESDGISAWDTDNG